MKYMEPANFTDASAQRSPDGGTSQKRKSQRRAHTRLTAPSPHLTPPKGSARQVSSDPPVKLPGVN